MAVFLPKLKILPPAQRRLWPELEQTPKQFALYGGTALALQLGHRASVDFDFFSNEPFDPDQIAATVPYLIGAERLQVSPNTLTCRVDRDGPVLLSFFGGLNYGQAASRNEPDGMSLRIASLLDIAGTKAAVVQKRAEAKDYIDIDALIQNGIDLPTALAAGKTIFGDQFNPFITLKALSYYDDLPMLAKPLKRRLTAAVAAVNTYQLPIIRPFTEG